MKSLLPIATAILFGLLMLTISPWQALAGLPTGSQSQSQSPSTAYGPPATLNPADWPMYGHDLQRTNYNPAEITISAGNVNQLVSRWQGAVGTGSTATSGAPSVANGKVYVGSSIGTGNNFFAFDAVSGTQVWSTTVGYVSSCFNVGIGSTSAISGTTLSVGGGDSAYYGLNANTGAQLWRNDMNVGASGFPWESPLLAYGRSYLGMSSRCDNPSVRGEVRAVDMTNGSAINSQYFVPAGLAGGGIWNSPALSPDGSTLVVATGEDYNGYNGPYNRAIVSLDPITLNILQYNQQGATGGDLDFGTTPLFFSDSQGRTLVGANHKNGVFYAYVLSNIQGGPLWSRATGTAVGTMPAYDPTFGNGGTLFIIGSGSQLYAVDPATGTNRWTPVNIGTAHGNIAVANGLIFVNNGSSGLRILDETNGALLRTLTPGSAGSANSGLAVSNGFIYWLSGAYLNAWSLPAGGATPTPTATTPLPTWTPFFTVTPTNTSIPTNTPTPLPPTSTNTSTRTSTPTFIPTNTSTNTPTTAPSNTPISTVTTAPSSTPASTFTIGPTNTPTNTPTTPTSIPTIGPTNTAVSTPTAAPTNTSTTVASTSTSTPPIVPSATPTTPPTNTATNTPTNTPTNTNIPTSTDTATALPTAEATATLCTLTFSDVPVGSTFYPYIRCLACRGIVNGYPDGTFLPGNNVTRGQLAKIVSNSAQFIDPVGAHQTFEDVAIGSTFYTYTERLASRLVMSGYPCNQDPSDPCIEPLNRPYFHPYSQATRGQIAKIVSNAAGFQAPVEGQTFEDVQPGTTFYTYTERLYAHGVISGYICNEDPNDPCIPPNNRPYYHPGANATRGQTSKIVSNTFYPGCNPRQKR